MYRRAGTAAPNHDAHGDEMNGVRRLPGFLLLAILASAQSASRCRRTRSPRSTPTGRLVREGRLSCSRCAKSTRLASWGAVRDIVVALRGQ